MIQYIFSRFVKWGEIMRMHKEAILAEYRAQFIQTSIDNLEVLQEKTRAKIDEQDIKADAILAEAETLTGQEKYEKRKEGEELQKDSKELEGAIEDWQKKIEQLKKVADERRNTAIALRDQARIIRKTQ